MAKKNKNKLTYFLDHPHIKRYKSPGNGESPGFFNQLLSGKLTRPSSGSSNTNPTGSSASESTASSGSNSGTKQTAWQKAFSKGFRGE